MTRSHGGQVVAPAADAVARAVPATVDALAGAVGGGWSGGARGAPALVTGIAIPTINGVWALEPQVSAADLRRSLEDVDAHGVPYGLQARPGCVAAARQAAEGMALLPAPSELPLMAVAGPVMGPRVPELAVGELGVEDADRHSQVAGVAFDTAPELFDRVTGPALRLPGTRLYLGEVDGEPVATALALTVGAFVAVFNVATVPGHRRRGYGAAITARAVNDGLAAGAHWSWLQSSEAGLRVYERLGFRVLERWSCWASV